MKIIYQRWKKIEDVPAIILSWTQEIGGKNININDVNDLVHEYNEYISKLDDTVQLESTIDQ